MALNTSPTRSDVGYLRRRVKPVAAAAPPAAQPAAAPAPAPGQSEPARPASSGLSLSPSTPSAPAAPAPARSAPSSSGLSLSPSTPPRSAAPAAPAPAATGPASAGPASAGPASSGLSLGPSTPAAPAAPARTTAPAGSLPFPAPGIDEVRELGDDDPVLRLNARESAIGSLIVTGAASAVWEDVELVTGAGTADGSTTGTPVTTAGNRPLVGFDDTDAIVSLRHVRRLRRALFVSRGTEPLGVQIFDGSTVTVSPGDEKRMFVLSLLRIGSVIELRAEPVDRSASDESILKQFAFTLTPFLVTRASRSR